MPQVCRRIGSRFCGGPGPGPGLGWRLAPPPGDQKGGLRCWTGLLDQGDLARLETILSLKSPRNRQAARPAQLARAAPIDKPGGPC